MPSCVHCQTEVHQEGQPWVHTATGRYRCPWPWTGEGFALAAERVDYEQLRETAREDGFAEGAAAAREELITRLHALVDQL